MLVKSVQTFRDYTTKNSNLFLLLAFLSKVTAYRVKSHLNRVISYLSLSIKTSVVLWLNIIGSKDPPVVSTVHRSLFNWIPAISESE